MVHRIFPTDMAPQYTYDAATPSEETNVSDKSTGKDKLHGSNNHVEKNDIWQEISGRLWQGALIGEGLLGGGAAQLAAGKAMTAEGLSTLAGGAVGGAFLGAVMRSKREAIKIAVGAIGTIAGGAYMVMEGLKYANDKKLATALDAVYKHQDWQTFTKQTKTAEKVLGHEGLNVILGGASGALGTAAGMKFAPGITRNFSPKAAEYFYGKDKPEVFLGSTSKRSVYEEIFDRNLGGFVNKISHGDIHVAATTERTKPYVFDRDNRITNIFIHKTSTPAEINRQIVVGSMTDRIGTDKAALEIALKGAEKASYHTAKFGDLDVAVAEGRPFAQSEIGQMRMLEGARRYAIEGSEARYRGNTGNDYSQYLQKVYGEWSPKSRVHADELVKGIPIDKVEDGYAYRVASESLANIGVRASDFNRAAACNDHIQMMDKNRQIEAIRAVSYYLQGHPAEYGLPYGQRIPALNELARKLTPSQVEVLTNRIRDFDADNFPHHIFEKPVMNVVDSLVGGGFMKDKTSTHKLLCRLAGQVNQENIDTAELFIHCARNAGVTEEQLLQRGITEAAAKSLQELVARDQKHMIPDLALCLKQLGQSTRHKEVVAVNTMRERGWRTEAITAETIQKYMDVLPKAKAAGLAEQPNSLYTTKKID